MYNSIFPYDFNNSKHLRDNIINDILFSVNPPLIENIYNCIPRPYSEIKKEWTKDLLEWDTWKIGALNTAYMFRKNEASGWGKLDSYKRNTMENNIYNKVKYQEKLINEQKKQIENLKNSIEKIINDKR